MTFEINDGLDSVSFPDYVKEFMRPAEFQRLGRVRQLGMVQHVFPQATHTRKVHSIGVAKTAMRIWDIAATNGLVCLDKEKYEPTILAAALYHDVGHAPYSHSLQHVMETFGGLTHEQVSGQLVTGEYSLLEFYKNLKPNIITENERQFFIEVLQHQPSLPDVLVQHDVVPELLAQLFDKKRSETHGDVVHVNQFLRGIISGLVDADRIEYLQRDPLMAGVRLNFDPDYLMKRFGVVMFDGTLELGVEDKGLERVVDLLNQRGNMHSRVYTHECVLRREAMMNEAISRIIHSLGERVHDVARSLLLLDDAHLPAFVSNYSQDAIATTLFFQALHDRDSCYAVAWGIEGKTVPRYSSGGLGHALYQLEGHGDVKQELLRRINTGKAYVEEHELIVYSRLATTQRTRDVLLKKFFFPVFNKKNQTAYNLADRVDHATLFDDTAKRAFEAYARPVNSYHFMVLTPKQHVSRVRKAMNTYVRELTSSST